MSNVMVVMAAALAAELLLVLFGLLLFAWIRSRAARNRDNKAMRVLITRIKNSMAERDAEVGRFLADNMGLSGEALEQSRVSVRRAELELLKRFAGVYKNRDAGSAAQFDIDVVAALAPYFELRGVAEGGVAEAAPADSSELEALRADNARLSEELTVTMETMSRMLNEYSTMFAGNTVGGPAPIGVPVGSDAVASEESAYPDEGISTAPPQVVEEDVEVDLVVEDVEDLVDEDTPEEAAEVTEGEMAGSDAADDPQIEVGGDVDLAVESPDSGDTEDVMQDDIDALFAAESQQDLMDVTERDEELVTAETEPDPSVMDEAMPAEPDAVTVDDALKAPVEAQVSADAPEAGPGAEEVNESMEETGEPAGQSVSGATEPAPPDQPETGAQLADLEGQLAEVSEADLPEDYLAEVVSPDALSPRSTDDPEHVPSGSDPAASSEAAEDPGHVGSGFDIESGGGELPVNDVEPAEDLDQVSSLFDTEDSELVAFDEEDDAGIEVVLADEDLFDAVEPGTTERAETTAKEVEGTDELDTDALFDAVDEPRITRSGQ